MRLYYLHFNCRGPTIYSYMEMLNYVAHTKRPYKSGTLKEKCTDDNNAEGDDGQDLHILENCKVYQSSPYGC